MSLPDKTIQQQALEQMENAAILLLVSIYHMKHTQDDGVRNGWKINAQQSIKAVEKAAKLI